MGSALRQLMHRLGRLELVRRELQKQGNLLAPHQIGSVIAGTAAAVVRTLERHLRNLAVASVVGEVLHRTTVAIVEAGRQDWGSRSDCR